MKKNLLLAIFAFCCISFGFSQADCATALALTPGTPQVGDTTGQAGSFSDTNTAPEVNPCSGNYNDLEYWFQYTAVATGETLDITVSDLTSNWYGVFVIDNCPDSTPTCVASTTNGTSMADLVVSTPALTAGVTYYIVLSDWIEGPTTFTMNTVVNAAPSCLEPTNLMVDSVTDALVNYSWTEEPGATLGTEVEIGLAGFAPGTGAETGTGSFPAGTNSQGFGPLTANTSYDIYIRSNCDANGFSDWAGPLSFTTLCGTITPDYTADMSVNVPDACWDEAGSGDTTSGPMDLGASDWRQGTSYALGSSNAINLFFNNDSEWLLSPTFDLSTGGPYQLEVNVAVTNWNSSTVDDTMGSDDEVQLLMSTDSGTTWTNITTWNAANEPPVDGVEYVEDLTALTGNVQFAILATDGAVDDSEDYDFHVGKFRVRAIPSCLEPSAIMASTITATSAELSWTLGDAESLWDLELVDINAAGTATGNATSSGVTNPYTIMGLTPQNDYEVYVRADCGGGVSAWVGPFAFSTPCAAFTAPYTEDFENAGTTPACWTNDGAESWAFATDGGDHVGNGGTITGATASGNYYAYADASGTQANAVLTSPLVDVSGLTTPALSFYEISDAEDSANSQLDVEVWDGAAWNTVGTYNTNTVGWELKIIDLSSLTITGPVQARFTFTEPTPGDFDDDIAIDDVSFDEAPACSAPTNLMVDSVTDVLVDYSWTGVASATLGYEVELGLAGFAPGTGAENGTGSFPAGTSSQGFGPLTPNTSYDIYIRSNCDANGFSDWAGPLSFTTECSVIVPDYTADMSVNTPDACWDEATEGDTTTGPMNLGGSDWRDGTSYAIGNSNAINLYFNNDQEWLLSPTFDLSTGGPYQLEVNVAVTNWQSSTVADAMGSDDEVQLLMTTDGGATWTNITTWNSANEPPVGGVEYVEDLSAITGNVQFAIYATDGTVDDGEDYDFHVGKFVVRVPPSCAEPTALTTTTTSISDVDIMWTAGDTETEWTYEYGVSPYAQGGGGTSGNVMTTPSLSLTGLTPGETYDIYIQANCGGSDSSYITTSWTQPVVGATCETAIDVAALPYNATDNTANYGDNYSGTPGASGCGSTSGYLGGDDVVYAYTAIADGSINIAMSALDGAWNGVFVYTDCADIGTECVAGSVSGSSSDDYDFDVDVINGTTYYIVISTWPTPQSVAYTLDITENVCTSATVTIPADPIDNTNCPTTVDVSISIDDLGDSGTLTITADDGAGNAAGVGGTVSATGIFTITNVPVPQANWSVTIAHESNTDCDVVLGPFILDCPPANDDIAAAVAITVDEGFCDGTNTNGTNDYATDSNEGAGTCFNAGADNDVWFTFTVPAATATVDVSTDFTGGTLVDSEIAVYSGTSGALVELGCSQDEGTTVLSNGSSWNSIITDLAVTVGETYYVQVAGYASGSQGTFCLDISTNQVLSTNEFENEAAFTYYPNPVKNTLTLNAQNTIEHVTMFNMLGQEVLRATPNTIDSELDMSNLQSGTYFVKVTIANVTETIRVIKE